MQNVRIGLTTALPFTGRVVDGRLRQRGRRLSIN